MLGFNLYDFFFKFIIFYFQETDAIETSDQVEAVDKEQENTSENIEESVQKDINDTHENETETETPTTKEGKDYFYTFYLKLILKRIMERKTNIFKISSELLYTKQIKCN